jgi:Na+/phosphate symporter
LQLVGLGARCRPAADWSSAPARHLLNLLAAIALLVWGTHIVRTGVLRVYGANLRHVISRSSATASRPMLAGLAVTSLVQSSTATCLIVASFVGRGWCHRRGAGGDAGRRHRHQR